MLSSRNTLSPQKEVVRKFYKEMWDNADTALIPTIFHHDFTFRGSLGPALFGHAQFAEYVAWVTQSIAEYTTDILEMVEEDNRVFGRVLFHGIQRRTLFGIEPTNRRIEWQGAPLFTFDGSKVQDLWVLGDIYGLVSRMKNTKDTPPEFSLAS
jgi:predicted ester cyclase